MRRRISIATFAAAFFSAALVTSAFAQNQPAQKAPDPAKPYKQVAVTAPPEVKDPSFAAFRAKLGDAAKRKDRAALTKLVASKGFFWERDSGDGADKKKSGIDNLSAAIGLSGKDASGWDMLSGYADDPTGSVSPDHSNSTCAPADPGFDGKAMQDLLEATQSDIAEWGYPVKDGVEVRDKADEKAPPSTKLGMYFVRVAADANAPPTASSFLRIVTPAGKYGYVSIDDVAPLGNDQLCYSKEGNDWKITGYIGAGGQP